jgi:hypothetical protein
MYLCNIKGAFFIKMLKYFNIRNRMVIRIFYLKSVSYFTSIVFHIDLFSVLYGGDEVFDNYIHVCETVNMLK